MENKLIRVIFDADMRCSHDGLTAIAKKLKVNVSELKTGDFVAFLNTKKSMIKLYAPGNVIAFYKSAHGQINLETLALIPKYFNGHELKYTDALREVMIKKIKSGVANDK